MTESRFKTESAYLANVAEAMCQHVLPQLSGQARARAQDCVNVVLCSAAALEADALPDASDSGQEALAWQVRQQRFHVLLQARAGVAAGALHDIEIVNVCAHVGPPLLLQIANQLLRVQQCYA